MWWKRRRWGKKKKNSAVPHVSWWKWGPLWILLCSRWWWLFTVCNECWAPRQAEQAPSFQPFINHSKCQKREKSKQSKTGWAKISVGVGCSQVFLSSFLACVEFGWCFQGWPKVLWWKLILLDGILSQKSLQLAIILLFWNHSQPMSWQRHNIASAR